MSEVALPRSTSPLATRPAAKVAVSDTLSTSKSVCPSTSKLPLASIFPLNVEIPIISKAPPTCTALPKVLIPVNVDKPATVIFEWNVDTPTTEIPAPTRTS